jgi:hypothetical protein
MDKNFRNHHRDPDGDDCHRPEELDGAQEQRRADRDREIEASGIKAFADFCEAWQSEIVNELLKSEAILKTATELSKQPEHRLLELLDLRIDQFVGALVTADIAGINLITSTLSRHSEITNNPTIVDAIAAMNQHTLDQLYDC